MADEKDYGLLINNNIKLHRTWFKQMVALHGIYCTYYAPRPSKDFDVHGDLNSKYYAPEKVGVIFQDHPDISTLKKMGWVAELQQDSCFIHVPYDLAHLEVGALFEIPSGIDNTPPRKFRVINMKTLMIYPASITCEVALEYEDTMPQSEIRDFTQSNFNILLDNEDDD